jgi:1,4-alpha-glucan branching enzyme
MHDNERSVIAFLRKDNAFEEVYLVVGHYTPVVQHEYRVGVPLRGHWREVLNSDAKIYGGQGEGNFGSVDTNNEPLLQKPNEQPAPLF